jgi:catechol 2,3-dioxygenase-like lactoylglutathione lyase family enzyme
MSSTRAGRQDADGGAEAPIMDMKLEVVVLPVSDVDRAKRFYEGLRFRLDADFPVGDDFRVVQVTPPGSDCAIIFGDGITDAVPGSTRDLQLVLSDTRLPGRVTKDTSFASAGELSAALERAAAAHGEHEARTGQADAQWPAWYADYMVREQAGEELPT